MVFLLKDFYNWCGKWEFFLVEFLDGRLYGFYWCGGCGSEGCLFYFRLIISGKLVEVKNF